jgi:tetratricopeptide (TPR) repeat protein
MIRRQLYRAGKFLRRHWGRGAVTLTMLVALLASAVVSVVQARAAREHQAAAEREAQRAQVVLQFLLDLFAKNSDQQSNPTLARERTARELLDSGASEATQQLDNDPELKAEVLNQLADIYAQLKLGERAGQLRRAAVDALKRAVGPRDPRVALALLRLAQDLASTHQRARAREALSEARSILDVLGDQTSEARGTSWLISAQINRYDSLPGLLSDAEQARRHFAEHPPEQLWSGPFQALELAGLGQQIAGHFSAAEELERQAISELQRRSGYSEAWRINPLIRIGECQYARAQLDAAVATLREALELSRRSNGDTSGETLQTQAQLGGILYGSGQRQEGLQMLDTTLATLESGPSTETSGAWSSLRQFRGAALLVEGRITEAEELWRKEVEDRRQAFPDSIPLARALLQHAGAALVLGRVDTAAAAVEEGCRLWRERSGGAAVAAMANDCWLAQARLALARWRPREAVAWLGQVAHLPEPIPLPLDTTEANVLLAWAGLQLRDLKGAESAARTALAQLEASGLRARYPALEASARLRLGQALQGSGATVDALRELETAGELFAAHGDRNSFWLGEAKMALARCLLGANPGAQQRQRAEELVEQARAIAAAHPALAQHLPDE